MSLRSRLTALERSCFRIAAWDGLPPRPAVERARDVCNALARHAGLVPQGIDVAAVRAALDVPDAAQAADAAQGFLSECVRQHCAAALDVEIENELRRVGPDGDEAITDIWRSCSRRRAR
jgi:hypothetical protein